MTPRQRNWLLMFAVVAMILLGQRLGPEPATDSRYFDAPRPMVIDHQGGDGLRPSNTLLAFQHAVDLGVDVLEMDVHLTADGALVLMHDATVDRTTDGTGALADMTLAELATLDAAHHWPYDGTTAPYRGRGVHVPALAEVVERFPELRYNIEIKPDDAAAGRALCGELRRLDALPRVLVASFHEAPLEAFRDACPGVPTSAYRGEMSWFYLRYRLGLAGLIPPDAEALQLPPQREGYDFTESGFVAAARAVAHLDYWTINEPEQMRRLVDAGADGIITDRPDLLLEVLGRR